MDDELWYKCEALAKSGRIDVVAHMLVNELRSWVTRDIDPAIDLKKLLISTYNKEAAYTVRDFLTHFVTMFNKFDIKAKTLK